MADADYEVIVVYDEENADFFGRVTGKDDGFTFIGSTPAQVKEEFRISFDDYLKVCAERGRTPDPSISGAAEANVVDEVHRAADAAAEVGGKTLEQWLAETEGRTITSVS